MGITNVWHSLSGENAPAAAGVYELGNSNNAVIYIGRAGDLSERIAAHRGAASNTCIGRNATKFRYEQTLANVTRERQLFEEFKQSHGGKIPACNTQDPSG